MAGINNLHCFFTVVSAFSVVAVLKSLLLQFSLLLFSVSPSLCVKFLNAFAVAVLAFAFLAVKWSSQGLVDTGLSKMVYHNR